MTTAPCSLDSLQLIAAGLPAHEVEQWRRARPAVTVPGKASEASLPADAEALRSYVASGRGLVARLSAASSRAPAAVAAARDIHEALRRARLEFLRSYAEPLYAGLTDDYGRFLRADALAALAARRYPGLVPTPEAVRAERRLAQKDKEEGAELDLGIFFGKVLENARAGSHLMHAMQRPRPGSAERLAAFRQTGEADLGVAHVARRGKAGIVELRNFRYLNAEDNAAVEALETAVDLVLLHPELEAGVLRGGVVDHPKHAGRRIFQAGANLTHLYDGQIGLVEFFLTRELGYINKMYRGLTGEEWVPGEAEATHEKPWIAAVESFAIGGGCQITLVCDRVLCEEGAYFSLPARQEGFVPGCANLRLARLGGERLARQAILFGRVLPAESPEAGALCDVVVPRGRMDRAIEDAIADITEGGAIALAAQRKAMRVAVETPDIFRQYMALYIREQAACLYSEGLVANLEKYWKSRGVGPTA